MLRPLLAPRLLGLHLLAIVATTAAVLLGVWQYGAWQNGREDKAAALTDAAPRPLASVDPRFSVPHRAELAIGLTVIALVLTTDLRGAIGFSSFAVLAYYAVANASALTLGDEAGRRAVPVLGLAGCVLVAASLPASSVLAGAAVLAAGAVLWLRGRRRAGASS